MTRLSVNLNKVALLRNQRDVGYPSLIATAKLVLAAGAHGITVHPRPDQRHVKASDIPEIATFLTDYNSPFPSFMMKEEDRGSAEFNIEGFPDKEFLNLVTLNACDQVTLVPDAPNQRTSDHGWNLSESKDFLKPIISGLRESGRRVSLFVDPIPDMVKIAADLGADRVEFYTGPYAQNPNLLGDYVAAKDAAKMCSIGINAGHDLNLENLAKFIAAFPECEEVSIGHAITADALNMGWTAAVNAYLSAIAYGRKTSRNAA